MEALKLTGMIIAMALLYGFVNDQDYHSRFDNYKAIRYNCNDLRENYHREIPQEVIEECQDSTRREVIIYKVQ